MELLSKLNGNKQYCSNIRGSAYEQRINTYPKKKVYHNINNLFIERFDPTCSLLDEKDIAVYMNQFLIEVASNIDEKPLTHYDNFNYSKQFKSSIIQLGLQVPNNVSSLLYLSDLYNVSSIIYIDSLQVKITTSKKTRVNLHILHKDGSFMELDDPLDFKEGTYDNLGECFVLNTSSLCIYTTKLQSIGKYKSPELTEIAKSIGIPLDNLGKKKIKKQLYDDINLYYLNNP